jgi:hypothetical protein
MTRTIPTIPESKPRGAIPPIPDTPAPSSIAPDPTLPGVTWELDIDNEEIDGVTLASLMFSSGAGQCSMSNFTPDALRAMADMMIDHAHDMDGKDFFNRRGLKYLLGEAYRFIGCYPYEVPDDLKLKIELAAGINRPDVFAPGADAIDTDTPLPEDAA